MEFLGSSRSLEDSSFCTVPEQFWVIEVSGLSLETPRMLLLSGWVAWMVRVRCPLGCELYW